VDVLAFAVGGLYAAGFYMMLRRSIVKEIIGLALLSNAASLLIFTAAGLTRGRPPIVAPDGTELVPPFADPVPQALVLTAIVISFAVLAFFVVLILRTVETLRTDDLDQMRSTET
jgi:multicomponent Na+:H+ antiporter subunit C